MTGNISERKMVISMQNEKIKKFIEPELIKCEKRLDEVTMCFGQYNCEPNNNCGNNNNQYGG